MAIIGIYSRPDDLVRMWRVEYRAYQPKAMQIYGIQNLGKYQWKSKPPHAMMLLLPTYDRIFNCQSGSGMFYRDCWDNFWKTGIPTISRSGRNGTGAAADGMVILHFTVKDGRAIQILFWQSQQTWFCFNRFHELLKRDCYRLSEILTMQAG